MTELNSPLVSVYIPSYKRPELAHRAILSILNQTYSPIEIVFCNDGSNDSRYLDLKHLIEKHNGIYLENSTPKGAPAARNKAIRTAKGYFITGLDDDDEFTNTRIQKMVDGFDSKYSFLASSYIELGINNKVARTFDTGIIKHNTLLHYNAVGNQIFTKTELLRETGGFDESLPAMQDHELWIRMTKYHGSGYKSPDLTYIVHTEHDSNRISSSNAKKKKAISLLQEKHKQDLRKSHYQTHKLIIKRAEDKPLTIIDAFKCINMHNYRLAIASYLRSIKLRK